MRRAKFNRAILDFTPNRWFHVVFNYLGPAHNQGYRVYINEILKANSLGISTYLLAPAIDTKIVIGRRYTEVDGAYSSLMADEVLLFNYILDEGEIFKLSD